MLKGSIDAAEYFASLPAEEQALIRAGAAELKKEQEAYRLRGLAAKAEEKSTDAGQNAIAAGGAVLSSLNSYVRRRGGRLKIVADLPDVGEVELELTSRTRIRQPT